MTITVFDPQAVQVKAMSGELLDKFTDQACREFFAARMSADQNASAIVIGDSTNLGVGVGTWEAGQNTKAAVPVVFDEVLVIVSGAFWMETADGRTDAAAGDIVHIGAGTLVRFGSDEGCRLVWITSPPTWVALEQAWTSGKIPGSPGFSGD